MVTMVEMNCVRAAFRAHRVPAIEAVLEKCTMGKSWVCFCTESKSESLEEPRTSPVEKEPETGLVKHLKTKIKMGGGPLSVAQFMREALINPKFGFYMNRDVFGRGGDFVTSPEVSQVFGELLGIWTIMTWEQMKRPARFKIIELGPGRGTLMADLLRGIQRCKPFVSALESVHLIEISQPLRAKQAETLVCNPTRSIIEDGASLRSSENDTRIEWHSAIEEVPKTCPEFVIGHEFLDALPVHQFIKSPYGWRERMIDIASDSDPLHLRFVQAPSITPAAALLPSKRLSWMSPTEQATVTDLEVGSDMLSLGIRLAKRLSAVGGSTLFIDYGKEGHYSWSVQGVRKHQRVNVLERPGETDVSAFVDFAALKRSVFESQCDAIAHGPIEQRYLLKALGIDARMEQLVEHATDAQFNDLKSGYERLIGSAETGQPEGMGKLYKAMAITRKNDPVPIGFDNVSSSL